MSGAEEAPGEFDLDVRLWAADTAGGRGGPDQLTQKPCFSENSCLPATCGPCRTSGFCDTRNDHTCHPSCQETCRTCDTCGNTCAPTCPGTCLAC